MTDTGNMRLEIWKGDWGLPSTDFECLQIMALAKIFKAPMECVATNNPFWTPKGRLPVFKHNSKILTEFSEIQRHFVRQGLNADFILSSKELSDLCAYTNLLKYKLEPALQFVWWLDERNYTTLTRKWHANMIPFPFNFYYPGQYERAARQQIDAAFPDEDSTQVIETSLYGEAEKCIVSLSIRLGEAEYFFGTEPTSLDAIIYGYLAPLLKAPLPTNSLQNHLKACPNLVRFVARITSKYFPNIPEVKPTPLQDVKPEKTKEEDFPHATRNKFLASLVASFAMLGYALVHGMIPGGDFDQSAEFEEIFVEE